MVKVIVPEGGLLPMLAGTIVAQKVAGCPTMQEFVSETSATGAPINGMAVGGAGVIGGARAGKGTEVNGASGWVETSGAIGAPKEAVPPEEDAGATGAAGGGIGAVGGTVAGKALGMSEENTASCTAV